jgi:hypothetical protein
MPDNHKILFVSFGMIALTALTSLAARRLRIPQSILLVVVGAALAFAPHFPTVSLHPDLVLLVLLPPLLYYSGVGMSWRGFKRNLRAIMLLAVGCAVECTLARHVEIHIDTERQRGNQDHLIRGACATPYPKGDADGQKPRLHSGVSPRRPGTSRLLYQQQQLLCHAAGRPKRRAGPPPAVEPIPRGGRRNPMVHAVGLLAQIMYN